MINKQFRNNITAIAIFILILLQILISYTEFSVTETVKAKVLTVLENENGVYTVICEKETFVIQSSTSIHPEWENKKMLKKLHRDSTYLFSVLPAKDSNHRLFIYIVK